MAENPQSHLGTLKVMPNCPGCGTYREDGSLCPACEEKPQFKGMGAAPTASIVLDPQKEPPYHTQGNFKRLSSSLDEAPRHVVLHDVPDQGEGPEEL